MTVILAPYDAFDITNRAFLAALITSHDAVRAGHVRPFFDPFVNGL